MTSSGVTPDAAMRSCRAIIALLGEFFFLPELGLAPPLAIWFYFIRFDFCLIVFKEISSYLADHHRYGPIMTPEERMKAILERKEKADNIREAEEERLDRLKTEAAQKRVQVEADWGKLRVVFIDYAKTLNDRLGNKTLHLYSEPHQNDLMVEILSATYEKHAPNTLTKEKLALRVFPDGIIRVVLDSRERSKNKHFDLDATTASHDDIKNALLDFVEATAI